MCLHERMNAAHLVSWRTQSEELRVSVPLPRLPIGAVQLLVTAEGRQPLHSLIRGQAPQAKVRGSQCVTGVLAQPCKGWRLDLGQQRKEEERARKTVCEQGG